MIGYIKNRMDFKTVGSRVHISEYEAVVAGLQNHKSKFETASDVGAANTDNWFVADGHIWVINEVSPEDEISVIQCTLPVEAFDREISLPSTDATTIGGFIAEVLTSEYRDQSDPLYAMPYLEIVNKDTTPFIPPETDGDGVFCLSEYMYQVAKDYKVICDFAVVGSKLKVNIFRKTDAVRTIVFGRGDNQIEAQTFSRAEVAKVTTVQGETVTDWYLATDGTISTAVPTNRATGKWIRLILKEDDDAEAAARKEFETTSASHKIEWWSGNVYELCDKLQMRLGNRKVTGEVTYIGIRSGDERRYYHSGELAVTITDKLRSVI